MSVPVGVLRAPVYFPPATSGSLLSRLQFPFDALQHRLVAVLMTP